MGLGTRLIVVLFEKAVFGQRTSSLFSIEISDERHGKSSSSNDLGRILEGIALNPWPLH